MGECLTSWVSNRSTVGVEGEEGRDESEIVDMHCESITRQ